MLGLLFGKEESAYKGATIRFRQIAKLFTELFWFYFSAILEMNRNLKLREVKLSLFKKDDVCEIVAVHEKDHYFDKRNYLIGKKIRIIVISPAPLREEGFFSGFVEFPDGVQEIKIEKGGFAGLTHVELKKI